MDLIGATAMAGAIGGGGLGDVAITYGYQRFNTLTMIVTVVILVIMVQDVRKIRESIRTQNEKSVVQCLNHIRSDWMTRKEKLN